MKITEELKYLSIYIGKLVTERRTEVKQKETEYSKGIYNGSADAYELCKKWIDEILERSE